MARVKFYKINNSSLSSLPKVEGQLIFVQDTGALYIDKDSSTRVQIDGIKYTGSDGITISEKNITNAGVRAIETGATNGTISVNTNGTSAEVSVYGLKALAYKDNISTSNITSGTLGVNRGGTGKNTLTSGSALIGNGTSAVTFKAIDTTSGGTASSTNLITSGAVNAGLSGKLDSSLKGASNGLAELDANGMVPASQLPSYVDDVIELLNVTSTAPSTCATGDKYYNTSSKKIFTATGTNTWGTTGENPETGKIYVNLNNNKTYRYSGSDLVVISETLALGETSSTAYRGDRGKTAYTHATDSNRLTTAKSEGLYKIATTAEGHIKSATAVGKADITALGITDEAVAQTNSTTASDYRLLLSGSANDTTATEGANKSVNFTANPSTGAFYAKGYKRIDITSQTIDINTYTLNNGTVDSMHYVCKTSGGSNNITNIPVAGYAFILDVELIRWASSSDYITMQTFVSVNKTANSYVRYCTNGTWGSWTTRVYTDTNTKNTAGSTDTSSKIFLIGATSQAANPQTYSDNEVFATSGVLQAKSFSVNGGATIEYNSTDNCIEFNFS